VIAVDDDCANAPVVADSYGHQISRDYAPEVRRRPPPDPESFRGYIPPDAVSSGPSVQGFSGTRRGPPVAYGGEQTVRVVDSEAGSMRCETCARPALFVCSACKTVPYCSVECQVFRFTSL